ncbi:hypothetical protein FRC06_003539, partial [Ceratobasidium sp. 370]
TDPVRKDPILASLEDLFADPNLDHVALWRGLVSTGVPFRVQKDRKNEVTGLGYGWPSSSAEDTSRIPTVVPKSATGCFPVDSWSGGARSVDPFSMFHSPLDVSVPVVSPLSIKAPVIRPVEFSDEDEMSPLTLPESVLSVEDELFLGFTQAGDYSEAELADSTTGIVAQPKHE